MATALLLYSVWYGFSTVDSRNFEPVAPAHADSAKVDASGKRIPAPAVTDEKHLTGVGFQKAILIMFWVLVPPIWFWLEYFGLWRYEDKTIRIKWEELQFAQELSAKIWLATVTALGILYFGKDIRGGG